MRENYKNINRDIKTLPNDGTIVVPLSIGKLHGHQSHEKVYEFLEFFVNKVQKISNDVVFLYTDGLYLNSFGVGIELHKKIIYKVHQHKHALEALIENKKTFVPKSFHYVTWNECILRAFDFIGKFSKLEKRAKGDPKFLECIVKDMGGRELNEANIRFMLEEIVMSHCIRHHEIEFPKTLSQINEWNLIAYPGPCMQAEVYADVHGIIRSKKCTQFSKATYDIKRKLLLDFNCVV